MPRHQRINPMEFHLPLIPVPTPESLAHMTSWQGRSPLRASTEHLPSVRGLRAQGTSPSARPLLLPRQLHKHFFQIRLPEPRHNLLRRPLRHNLAPLEKDDPVRHFFHLMHIV